MNKLRKKILSLAVLPLVAAVTIVGALLWFEMQRLEARQERLQEDVFLAAKRAELRNYMQLGLTSIEHLYSSGRNDAATQREAQTILRAMNFGDDGYFFVYDMAGRSLMHPRLQDLEGRSLQDMQDPNGVYVIRELIARAREGGGFQRYEWAKPSSGRVAPKLGYAVQLERWGWMVGTGLYLDDIDAAAVRMRQNLLASVQGTLFVLAAVAVVGALLVFAGGITLNISEQRLADRKIRQLADRVVLSQEEERARVSRELHDHVCQLLVSVKYKFELAAHETARGAPDGSARLREAIAALSGAIGDVRRISHDLRPALLDDLGLVAALQLLGNELAQRSGLQVKVSATEPEPPLAPEETVDLFRIAQEALRNCELHAQASSVDVSLGSLDGGVVLRIADDGRGFEVGDGNRSRMDGIGLSNMHQRAERIGARFSLRSAPGRTVVEVWLPHACMRAALAA